NQNCTSSRDCDSPVMTAPTRARTRVFLVTYWAWPPSGNRREPSGTARAAASADLITGNTSKLIRSLHRCIHRSNSAGLPVSMSWKQRSRPPSSTTQLSTYVSPSGSIRPSAAAPLVNRPRSGKVPLDHHVKHGTRLLAEDAEYQAPSNVILIMWDRKGPQEGLFYPTSPDTAWRAVS